MSKKETNSSEYCHGYTDFVAYGSVTDPCPNGPHTVPWKKVEYLKGWLAARTAAKLGDPITKGEKDEYTV